jgi:hypothetical protein
MYNEARGLTKSDPNFYEEDQELIISDIKDAIMIGDAREIFYVDPEFTI